MARTAVLPKDDTRHGSKNKPAYVGHTDSLVVGKSVPGNSAPVDSTKRKSPSKAVRRASRSSAFQELSKLCGKPVEELGLRFATHTPAQIDELLQLVREHDADLRAELAVDVVDLEPDSWAECRRYQRDGFQLIDHEANLLAFA